MTSPAHLMLTWRRAVPTLGVVILLCCTTAAQEPDEPGVAQLIEALRHPLPARRIEAARSLNSMGADAGPAVAALATALRDEVGYVRWSAARALGAIGGGAADAIPALVESLDDEAVSVMASLALSRIGQRAVPALVEATEAGSERVRLAASQALNKIVCLEDRSVDQEVGALVAALDNGQESVRQSAILALRAIGPRAGASAPALIKLLAGDEETAAAVTETLGAIGTHAGDAIQPLRLRLKTATGLARVQAARALWQVSENSDFVVPALLELLHDRAQGELPIRSVQELLFEIGAPTVRALLVAEASPDHPVLCRGAELLKAMSPAAVRDALPELEAALRNGDPRTQRLVLPLFRLLGDDARPLIPLLIELLGRDAPRGVRVAAAQVLRWVGTDSPEAAAALVGLLDADDRNTKTAALEALAHMDYMPAEAVPLLIRMLDGAGVLEHAIVQALGNMPPEGIPALLDAMTGDAPPVVRLRAKDVFRQLQLDPAIIPALQAALAHERPAARQLAAVALAPLAPDTPELLAALTASMKIADAGERRSLVGALGRLGARAVPAIVEALDDPDGQVAMTASAVLGHMGAAATKGIPRLIAAFSEDRVYWGGATARNTAMRSLHEIGGGAIPALRKAAQSPDREVRMCSVICLGWMAGESGEAREVVRAALQDDDPEVKGMARKLLDELEEKR